MSDHEGVINWDSDENDDAETFVSSPENFGPPAPLGYQDVQTEPYSESYEVEHMSTLDTASEILSVESAGEGEHMTVVQVDAYGNETTTVVDLALPPLSEEEARTITERIKSTTNILYLLIKRAHAGKAWKALGYSSFEAYVREEFNYSRSYAYKLLNQANVIEAIEAVVPEGTEVYVGELTARGLKQSLPELVEEIEDRTSGASPEEATAIIEDVIREAKEKRDEEESFDEDFDDDFTPGEFSNPSSAFDYIDEESDDLDEFLGGDDPSLVVHKLENLYTLLTGLQNFAELSENGNLEDLLPLIPEDRRTEVTSLIATNITWVQTLNDAWNAFLQNNAVSDIEDESFNGEEFHSDDNNGF